MAIDKNASNEINDIAFEDDIPNQTDEIKTPLANEMARLVNNIASLKENKKEEVKAFNEAIKRDERALDFYSRSFQSGSRYLEDLEDQY